jgi:DNA-binding NarL/FixJ family response regulator
VIYSAWDEARLRVLCAQLGADGYLSKSTSVLEIGKLLTAISGG